MRVFAGCLFASGLGAQELKENCSDRLEVIQVDISKEEQVKNAEAEVREKLDGGGKVTVHLSLCEISRQNVSWILIMFMRFPCSTHNG